MNASLWMFWRWLRHKVDCPRCDSPMRRTDQIVNRVEYVWFCRVCGGRLPVTDRRLVAAASGSEEDGEG